MQTVKIKATFGPAFFNMSLCRLLSGQLIKKFNWGPSQPTGDDQHCMYIVGGYLGYQWADFHCGFEMTFLCEHDVNGGNEAWRRRREMKKASVYYLYHELSSKGNSYQ